MYLAPLTLSLVTLPFLTPAPLRGPATAPADHAAAVLAFPMADGPLEIPAGVGREGYSIWDLLQAYAGATDQHVIANEETLNFCQQSRLNLTTSMSVPPQQLQTVVESLLVQNDFVMRVVHTGSPRILAVTSLNTGARTNIRDSAVFVPSDRLEEMRAHPAMLFTTTVNLPKTDVRQLANSMRTLITDANTQQMLPAGATNTMLLTGYGSALADLIEMLTRIDEAAVVPPPAPPAETTSDK